MYTMYYLLSIRQYTCLWSPRKGFRKSTFRARNVCSTLIYINIHVPNTTRTKESLAWPCAMV